MAAFAALLAVTAVLAQPAAADLHTGYVARDCGTIRGDALFVRANGDDISCKRARQIASQGFKGTEPKGYDCKGVGTPYGNCRGTGELAGTNVKWVVND